MTTVTGGYRPCMERTDRPRTSDASRTRRTSRGILVGATLGIIAGAAIGLVIGLLINEGWGAGALAAALAGAIFGGLLAAFWGGMSRLEAPPRSEDPSRGPQDRDVPGA